MKALEVLLLLLTFLVDLLLLVLQILIDSLLLSLFPLDLLVESLDLGIVLGVLLMQSLLYVFLLLLDFLLLIFDLLDQLVLVVLLDQDLLRRCYGGHALQFLLRDRIVVFDAQARQHPVKANRE